MSIPIQQILSEAKQQALDGQLAAALAALQTVYSQRPSLYGRETFDNIRESHQLMLDYFLRGYADKERAPLYGRLLRKTYVLTADLEISWRCKNLGIYATAFHRADHLNLSPSLLREVLERFVGDAAMLSLETEERVGEKRCDLYQRHQAFMDRLFCALFVAVQWTDDEARAIGDIILLPTIDQNDALIMVSALTLSAISQFDLSKTRLLAHVYASAQDALLRQRALVGLAFSLADNHLYGPQLRQLLDELSATTDFASDLADLHKQVFYCLEADEVHEVIQNDIMPSIMKNTNLRLTRLGIEEVETDPLEEMLHPDAEDRAMEELEQNMDRMRKMMKSGSDIFFGGFAQMKKFPFFGVLSNWFTPFYLDHPSLADKQDKLGADGILKYFFEQGSFCESDKYSLAFAVAHVYDTLPPALRETMHGAPPHEESTASADALARRLYLQDLYRFYRIHPNRSDLCSPFALTADGIPERAFVLLSPLFDKEHYNQAKLAVARFLHVKHQQAPLRAVLATFEANHMEYYLLRATTRLAGADAEGALADSESALRLEIINDFPALRQRALRAKGAALMRLQRYAEAADAYRTLTELKPDAVAPALSLAVALMESGQLKAALEQLFKLNYLHPDNANVARVLAWALLLDGKAQQAERYYAEVLAHEPSASDWLNAGYAAWATGSLTEAAERFSRYVKESQSSTPMATLREAFSRDRRVLEQYAFKQIDTTLLCEAVTNV